MADKLQQLKYQLETVKLRSNGIQELIELKIKELYGFNTRQLILEREIAELEKGYDYES
jgi:hypothetical protein